MSIFFHSFTHLLSIFLWGSYISILSISNVGNEQLPELHYGEILILPPCLVFSPGPLPGEHLLQRHGNHVIHVLQYIAGYRGLGIAVVIFFPSQTFGNHSSMTMPDRKEHLKMQPISKSVSF